MEDNVEMRTLPPVDDPVKVPYRPLCECLESAESYKEVCLNDFSPEDCYTQRHWMDKLQLPFPTMMYHFPYGNHLGVVPFIWKTPACADQTQVARLISRLNERQDYFVTWNMGRDFIDRYTQHVKN